MFAEKYTVAIACSSGGAATAYSATIPYGRILSITVGAGLDSGADLTITVDGTAEAIVTLSNTNSGTVYPRVQVHDAAGAGRTYDGTRTVAEPVTVANDRVKVVVAQGGTSTTATLTIVVG